MGTRHAEGVFVIGMQRMTVGFMRGVSRLMLLFAVLVVLASCGSGSAAGSGSASESSSTGGSGSDASTATTASNQQGAGNEDAGDGGQVLLGLQDEQTSSGTADTGAAAGTGSGSDGQGDIAVDGGTDGLEQTSGSTTSATSSPSATTDGGSSTTGGQTGSVTTGGGAANSGGSQSPDTSDIAGLWNYTYIDRAEGEDVVYLEFSVDGQMTIYDYHQDEFDNGENCYSISTMWLESLDTNRYRVIDSDDPTVINPAVTLKVSDNRIHESYVDVNDENSNGDLTEIIENSYPRLSGIDPEFNACEVQEESTSSTQLYSKQSSRYLSQ